MNDDYYNYMIGHGVLDDGYHQASIEVLKCLKAKAYLEISDLIAKNSKEDENQMKKHKADVFRLGVMLTAEEKLELPQAIQKYFNEFAREVTDKPPDKAIFKEMGLGSVNPQKVYHQILKTFNVTL